MDSGTEGKENVSTIVVAGHLVHFFLDAAANLKATEKANNVPTRMTTAISVSKTIVVARGLATSTSARVLCGHSGMENREGLVLTLLFTPP